MFIPAHGGLKSSFQRVLDQVTSSLKRIDESPIRGEYKARIFSKFYLPGIQYLLTVHHIGITHFEQLDALGFRHLRKWLNIPPSATRPIFTSEVFDLEPFSKMVTRAAVGSHTRMREKADPNVQFVLDAKIAREDELKKDSMKPTTNAERVYLRAKADQS